MNIFVGHEQRCRHREQTCGHRGEGEGGMNWEIKFDINTFPYVKQIEVGTCCIAQGAQLGALW